MMVSAGRGDKRGALVAEIVEDRQRQRRKERVVVTALFLDEQLKKVFHKLAERGELIFLPVHSIVHGRPPYPG